MVCEFCGRDTNATNSELKYVYEGRDLCIYAFCDKCCKKKRQYGPISHDDNIHRRIEKSRTVMTLNEINKRKNEVMSELDVEDDKAVRKVLGRQLKDVNYEVEVSNRKLRNMGFSLKEAYV